MLLVDKSALNVVQQIKSAHNDWCQHSGAYESIFLLFAHDLMIHFSGILLQREAKDEYSDRVKFPYVTKRYAQDPYRLSDFGQASPGNWSLKLALRRLGLSSVALGHAVPIDKRNEWICGKWINLLGVHKPFSRAFLPKRKAQIGALRVLIENLCHELEIRNVEEVWDNWYRYLDFHTTDQQQVVSENGLIVGTRNHIQNRKLAINYLQQGKEVVAVTHGEVANSVMDEPPFGYSERTLCSVLVDYGDFDKSGEHNEPWVSPRKKIYRSGTVARHVHLSSPVIPMTRVAKPRGLYIPTTYHGNRLYGPFHVYEDRIYRNWQINLLDSLDGLTFKAHPKSLSEPVAGVPVERRTLENCFRNYDYLVFDYFATGAMLGLVSDKPVIYCDIGLRNLHPEFLEDLKNRCEYVKIDLENLDKNLLRNQLREAVSNRRSRSNEGMNKYVFCKSTEFSWASLFSQLNAGHQIALR